MHYGTTDQATPLPVSCGNQKPASSPVLLSGQIPCPICKIGCYDRQTLLEHVSAEYPSYKFMCDEANCFKAYISKSGLSKHKKPIFCRIVMTACYVWIVRKLSNDNHQCPAQTPKPKQKKQPKTEWQENFEGEGEGPFGGKRNTRSTQIKKEK